MIITNKYGIINYASPSVKVSLGYHPEEMIGMSAFMSVHPEDGACLRGIDRSGPNNFDRRDEYRLKHKGGEYKWFEGTVKPMPSEFGDDQLIMSSWEIDDRKKMEMQIQNRESTLRAVFDNYGEYMMLLTLEGNIIAVNSRLCESAGFTEDELIGSAVINLIAPSNQEYFKSQVRGFAQIKGENNSLRIVVNSKQGIEKHIIITSHLVHNPGERPFVVVSGVKDKTRGDAMCLSTI